MNPYRTGAAAIAVGLSLVWASSSRAGPPPPMWGGTFAVPVVACDTKDEAIAIANAGRESAEALLATYRQMSTTVDGKGDPTCANSRISYLVVNEREDFGIAHAASGDLMHIWVVHGGTSKRDFWFIFAQPDPQTNARAPDRRRVADAGGDLRIRCRYFIAFAISGLTTLASVSALIGPITL